MRRCVGGVEVCKRCEGVWRCVRGMKVCRGCISMHRGVEVCRGVEMHKRCAEAMHKRIEAASVCSV